jgi:hypothetical protein
MQVLLSPKTMGRVDGQPTPGQTHTHDIKRDVNTQASFYCRRACSHTMTKPLLRMRTTAWQRFSA